MCIHASFMPTEFCSACHPVPKPIRVTVTRDRPKRLPGSQPVQRVARGTTEFRVDAALIDTLCDCSSDGGLLRELLTAPVLPASESVGCIYYRPPRGTTLERLIPIWLRDDRAVVTSAARAVYAATVAHQEQPLAGGQNIAHVCGAEEHDDIRLCCINPAHITGA